MMKLIGKIFLWLSLLGGLAPSATQAQQSCVGTPGQVKWSYWAGFNSYLPDSTDLAALENFPSRPDGSQMLSSLKAPINYTENFAGMIRGYIYVNQTETYRFNLTGDERALFYLSTNDTPANKRKRAEATIQTNITEHNKTASQTSPVVQLVAGQNYYFEIYTFEGCCNDHTTLYWRKTTNPDTTWRVIDFNNIKEYTCGQNCPPRGTTCNDGNAQTTNDQQDGFCNCVGQMPTANTCVGTQRGVVDAYYFDNITGSYVEPDLINSPKFPLLPDRREKLTAASGPIYANYAKDSYGSMVQGYLTVPQSGMYEFNITGDDQTIFYLSKNDSTEYKQYHQALTLFGIDETAHSTYSFQSTAPIFMEKGKYYYYEIRHKESGWRDHFNLYWKTPFHEQRSWKRISNFYLFDYKCEISCVPNNTPCNDGNAFTNNDRYQNCECVGTPCSGPDCNDATARYQKYDACAPTQNIINTTEAAWESCAKAANPARPNQQQHWIRYDLGQVYQLKSTRVWNYNAQNQTNKGFKTVLIDYSTDGTTWQPLGGTYNWPQAPGTSEYAGFLGPNFNNIKARYVLVSATSQWDQGTCAGFSKITFEASACQPKDTPCDDGDPLTVYDRFDANCSCRGVKLSCIEDTIRTGRVALVGAPHRAKKAIISQGTGGNTQNISFTAGNSIVLLPGFEVKSGGLFSAQIAGCLQAAYVQSQQMKQQQKDTTITDFQTGLTEDNSVKQIVFRLNKPSQVKLVVKDAQGKLIATLIEHFYENLGTQIKYLPTGRLAKGNYAVELTANDTKITEPFAIE